MSGTLYTSRRARPSPRNTCDSERLGVALFAFAILGAPLNAEAQTTGLRLHESLGGTTIPGVAGVFTLDEAEGVRPEGGVDRYHIFETFNVGSGDTVEWTSLFNENTSLDLTGSFIVSTADRIEYANGSSLDLDRADFDTVNALQVSAFESFGFLASEESMSIGRTGWVLA